MIRHYCCGVIPVQCHQEQWQLFLVQHRAGHWSFPKGHREAHESVLATAERELREETALAVAEQLSVRLFRERYTLPGGDDKIVDYVVALVQGKPKLQKEELINSCWLSLDDAMGRITFPGLRALYSEVRQLLLSLPLR